VIGKTMSSQVFSGTNLSNVFDKLNDLKNLFKFGERIVPIIQSLIEFMKEIVPLLENINSSISDSTTKMPQATNQINNVTKSTELATTEILDLVDKITNVLYQSEEKLNKLSSDSTKRKELLGKIKELSGANTDISALVDQIIPLDQDEDLATNLIEQINTMKEDTYQITLSLQVQDITAQQLAAVNHLINSVHTKLATLVSDIDQSQLKGDFNGMDIQVPEGVTFDPKASYTKDGEKQKAADQIYADSKQQASQADIDKLFS